jgi:hypothetical protein
VYSTPVHKRERPSSHISAAQRQRVGAKLKSNN